jgi:hypothetical protein
MYLSNRWFAGFAFALTLTADGAFSQQTYPELPTPPVVLENQYVIVQRMHTYPAWAGIHTHPGKQLAVVIQPFRVKYKDSNGEYEKSYEAGDVFWIDLQTHDHRPLDFNGMVVLITLK